MRALIIKNTTIEGPGTIGDYLHMLKLLSQTVDLSIGESIPELEQFSHLLIMGGPMAVYEMERNPFLRKEAELIEKALKADKHVLGVCLGAQMIAHVLGAKVYAGAQKEIGWYEIELTDDAVRDPIMSELAAEGKKNNGFSVAWRYFRSAIRRRKAGVIRIISESGIQIF